MTSAHSRKASSNHLPSLSAVPPVPNVSGEKSEFIAALHVMNEATMENACLLLLSERDYDEKEGGNNNSNEEPSDHDKLWDIYYKCANAAAIIKKQQPTEPQTPNSIPGAPSLPPPLKRGVGGVGGVPKLKPGIGNKPGVIPMRRTTHLQHKGSTPGAASLKRGIERDQSYVPDGDASPASTERSAGSSSKKPRQSPPTTLKQVSTPPASALNFLAKLNKDPKEQEKKQQKQPPPPPPNKRSNRRPASA
jgi:hypothetical protein